MRYFLILLLALCLATQGHGLGSTDRERPGKTIAVSIQAQAYFAKRIAGDRLRIVSLLNPGQSPHSYEPSPRQLSDLSYSSVWITIGVEFEDGLKPKIAASFPKLSIVDGTEGVRFRSLDNGGGEHFHESSHIDEDVETPNRDPHIWLGAEAAKTITLTMAKVFAEIDPEGANSYMSNAQAFAEETDTLFTNLKIKLAALRGQAVLVYHPAFGYFLDEFDIRQKAVETGGKEPTPKQLSALIEEARRSGIQTVFVQSQFPANAAKTIADSIGGTVIELDPLAYDWLVNITSMGEALASLIKHEATNDAKLPFMEKPETAATEDKETSHD